MKIRTIVEVKKGNCKIYDKRDTSIFNHFKSRLRMPTVKICVGICFVFIGTPIAYFVL